MRTPSSSGGMKKSSGSSVADNKGGRPIQLNAFFKNGHDHNLKKDTTQEFWLRNLILVVLDFFTGVFKGLLLLLIQLIRFLLEIGEHQLDQWVMNPRYVFHAFIILMFYPFFNYSIKNFKNKE